MSILSAANLGQYFGTYDVFHGISASVPNDAKIGLVGPNGVGKTTLLRILAGIDTPTSGSVHRAKGTRLGYLRQEAVDAFAERDNTVYGEMLTVFAALRAQAVQLQEMEARMAGGDMTEALFEEYGAVQEAFEHAGGYEYEIRIAQVLEGLGFSAAEWDMPLGHLSGGQKTRALLARLLLETPDLLILDEPTNHLDVQAIEWLERALRAWKGALLVVSHDRYFLDNVVDHIWEMSRTGIEVYRGNYSAYVQHRQERWDYLEQTFEAEKARLEKELDFIRRNIEGQGVDIARGKLKRLSRELVAIQQLGFAGVQGKSWMETGVGGVRMMTVDEAARAIKGLERPVGRPPTLNMRLQATGRSGTLVLRTRNLQVGYPGKSLFESADIVLERLECAALIGPNGAGKTTFLRTALGHLPPLDGEVTLGASLKVGYFAQAHDSLNPEQQVIEALLAERPGMAPAEARNYLAGYLFRGDDVWKPVGALSGGERARLALALLALDGANFLVLDEPTNHLDIHAQEVLQAGLEGFGGTLLLVTHDRYLVDRLATQIWELRDGCLHVFRGTYKEFLAAREQAARRAKEAAPPAPPAPAPAAPAPARPGKAARREAETLAALEARISATEAALAECERHLQTAGDAGHYTDLARLGHEYTATQAELDRLMAEWEALATVPV
ncbi:MAG TPA: ABC-F family ATP-binding cassette domain-containing protein [Chloroflexia bacterium]|nr:ABC-F family ATP-binding cassette domain-containing protein [Chloroflexia bacterium]